jgi:putative hydrolases of HD superfamily
VSFEQRLIELFESVHPLDRVARAGYVLRGVTEPESVAAHSHFVSLMTLLFVDEYPGLFDRDKALAMALIHDLSEAVLMDVPMPAADGFLREAKTDAEQAIFDDMFAKFSPTYSVLHQQLIRVESAEARLVRGLDKAQMMIKIVMYQREGRGRLEEFWDNPRNFADFGLEPVSRLFDAICAWASRPRPNGSKCQEPQ